MILTPFAHLLTMKNLIRVAFTALSLSTIPVAHSQTAPFHAPQQNYYQNSWTGISG